MATGHGAGLRIAGYADLVELGRGGFAVVYRARRVAFGQDVAIKVLDRAQVDGRGVERLARERQVLGLLAQHPNVVTLYDAGTTEDGAGYLVMEYLPGGTLAERLARRGPLPVQDVVDIAVRLCGALATAHRVGVLHRDIKPDNVLVSRFGEPVLADFGLARVRGGMRTRTGIVTATLSHAPPEVLDGHPPTARSDLYSLASTAFTLLTGAPPFSRDSDIGVVPLLARIARDPVPDLRPRGVPGQVCAVLEGALAKEPEARPASAVELGQGLRDAQRALGCRPTTMVVEDVATGAGFGPRTETSALPSPLPSPPPSPPAAPPRTPAPAAPAPAPTPRSDPPTARPARTPPATSSPRPAGAPPAIAAPRRGGPSTSFAGPSSGPPSASFPPPPPPDASFGRRPRRRWPWFVVAAAVVAALAVAASLLFSRTSENSSGPGTVTYTDQGDPVAGRTDPQVVDFGFTPVQAPDGGWLVAYGIRLHNPNTTDWVLTSARLTVRFADDSGAPLGAGQQVRVGYVPTGGDAVVPPDPPIRRHDPDDHFGAPAFAQRPARMDIDVGQIEWGRAVDYATGGIVAGPAVLRPRPDQPGAFGMRADVECRLTSTFTDDVHPVLVNVLLRDDSGAVVAAEGSAQVNGPAGTVDPIAVPVASSVPLSVRLVSVPPAARAAECYPAYPQPLA
jgi:serine/threonine protein kinase